jgi:crotonobetainyl-CoA:carnitine CoA-transferase CaiB-like acyl-CoA transferase
MAIFAAWLQRHTRQDIVRKAQRVRLPGTAINTPREVLSDPHFVERQAFVPVPHPVAGTWRLPGAPFRAQATPWQIRRAAPLLGQDTVKVLQEFLHLSTAEIDELQQTHVIG